MEPVLHIKTRTELQNALKKYNCKDVTTLSDLLWNDYGVCLLIDEKLTYTMTNI